LRRSRRDARVPSRIEVSTRWRAGTSEQRDSGPGLRRSHPTARRAESRSTRAETARHHRRRQLRADRHPYIFFDSLDGAPMSVKWEEYKMILRYVPGPGLDAINHGEIKPVLPLLFDLSSDPHEDNNLWIGMVNGWVYGPMLEVLDRFEKSVEEYPNIKPGEE